jgi:FdhD protein
MGRNIITVPIQKAENGSVSPLQDLVAVEEPLQIRLGKRNVAITMRTPGHDLELAAGFLFTEGILKGKYQVSKIVAGRRNTVTVMVADEAGLDLERLDRHFYLTSSCGICGKASIEAVKAMDCAMLPRDEPQIGPGVIQGLPETLRPTQEVFERTGGLHAAALFNPAGKLLSVREDVGRHNAVDKLIGGEFLEERLPLNDRILMVSGRASFELVQKALMAGIPVLAAVGAPSSLAIELALRFGMTLCGFVRGQRFNIYSGAWRCGVGASV